MASFTQTLKNGHEYAALWPNQPELDVLFPEQRVIVFMTWCKTLIPALITITTCLQMQWGNQESWPSIVGSFIFAFSLPLQGYLWLGMRASTSLPPHLNRWYREINSKMGGSASHKPSYFDLAATLRQAYEQLDRAFVRGI